MSLRCWNCGGDISAEPLPLSRQATCDQCGEFLHCCRFCEQFDRDRPGQCDNDLAEPPNEKTTANFCEYFKLNANAFGGTAVGNDSAKAKLSSLFDDDIDLPPESDSSNPLDDLFKD